MGDRPSVRRILLRRGDPEAARGEVYTEKLVVCISEARELIAVLTCFAEIAEAG